jgi:hypothetical protein
MSGARKSAACVAKLHWPRYAVVALAAMLIGKFTDRQNQCSL